MRYQPRKRKKHNEPLIILCLLAIALAIYIVAIDTPNVQSARPLQADVEYKTFEYTVTHVKGNEVYGKAKNDTGIFFDLTEIKLPVPIAKSIEEGSKIKVWMESVNHIDGIKKVEVIE